MPWTSKLAVQLKLRDGRQLSTLSDVRELLLHVPRPDRATNNWRRPAELLMQSAAKPALQADLQVQLESYLHGLHLI